MNGLLNKLKPEVRAKLESQKKEYPVVETLLKTLDESIVFSDLRIFEVSSLYLFAGIDTFNMSVFDFKYGVALFEK